jgi:hypothetical protein
VSENSAENNFEPKRKEVTCDRRKLHIEEIHNLYSSHNIVSLINPFIAMHERDLALLI